MNDFTASNGLSVGVDEQGAVSVELEPPFRATSSLSPQQTAAIREYFLHQLLAEVAVRAVVDAVYGPHEPQEWELDNARAALEAAILAQGPEEVEGGVVAVVKAEWEYGYRNITPDGRDLGIQGGARHPSDWLNTMGTPYRRLRIAGNSSAWEEAPEKVVIALASRPWLRPGADPFAFPLENRAAHNPGGWEFAPEHAYEQDIKAYGSGYAVCGRTDRHWSHGSLPEASVPPTYCDGIPK